MEALPSEVLRGIDAFSVGWEPTPSAKAYKTVRDAPDRSPLFQEKMRAWWAATQSYEAMSVRVADWILETKMWLRVFEERPPSREFLANLSEQCFDRAQEINEWREFVEVEIDECTPAAWLRDFEKRHWTLFQRLYDYSPSSLSSRRST